MFKRMNTKIEEIKNNIRDIPDFPKKGVIFKDITPILQNATLFKYAVDILSSQHKNQDITLVAAIDARGFIFGGAVADKLNVGLVPIRKKGKLPFKTIDQQYDLEYGSETMSMHTDAMSSNDKVLIIDDLLATGGTAAASVNLVKQLGAKVSGISFLIELSFLKGRDKIKDYPVFSSIIYDK
jgi:adenine phosphoribosyltransferase